MLLHCSHCRRNVLVGSSGNCPSCQRNDGFQEADDQTPPEAGSALPIVCHNTRTANTIGIIQAVILILIFGSLTIAGFRSQSGASSPWICLSVVVFFGIILFHHLRSRFSTIPRLTLDERGITLHYSGVTLLWRDFRSVRLRKLQFYQFLDIKLRDAETYAAQLTGFRRWLQAFDRILGQTSFSIPISATTVDAGRICRVVLDRSEPYLEKA